MSDSNPRYERRAREDAKDGDRRTPGQRDYDRIIYCSAFMRLAGVSQVAHTSDSAIVHNRMIHSLKVSTIGRGLAVRLAANQPDIMEQIGGLDSDVVAAAALGHDLGHPPFGHVAERELDHLVQQTLGEKGFSGFEGNAQSFRVVTKLAVRRRDVRGLNLTRATLNAILKYPWLREAAGTQRKKWGAYHTENDDFEFTRKDAIPKQRSVEAEIMDFADDVTYSTHDLEDYYRAGLIPLDRLFSDKRERDRFLEASIKKWSGEDKKTNEEECETAFNKIFDSEAWFGSEFVEPYNGTRRQRGAIRSFASTLIDWFFRDIHLCIPKNNQGRFVEIDPDTKLQIKILKQLIWYYVIPNKSLSIQEEGQRRIIKTLFQAFLHSDQSDGHKHEFHIHRDLLAPRYREQLDEFDNGKERLDDDLEQEKVRVVVDAIAEMSEFQAVQAYARLTGYASDSFLDFAQR